MKQERADIKYCCNCNILYNSKNQPLVEITPMFEYLLEQYKQQPDKYILGTVVCAPCKVDKTPKEIAKIVYDYIKK